MKLLAKGLIASAVIGTCATCLNAAYLFKGTVDTDFGNAANYTYSSGESGAPVSGTSLDVYLQSNATFPGTATTPFTLNGSLQVGTQGFDNVTFTLTAGTFNATGSSFTGIGQQSSGAVLSLQGNSIFNTNDFIAIGNDRNRVTDVPAAGEVRLADSAQFNVSGTALVIGRDLASGFINFISTGAAQESLTATAPIYVGSENNSPTTYANLYALGNLRVDGQTGTQLGRTFAQEFTVTGNTLTLNAVPEPATLSVLSVGAMAMLGRKRRRA